MSKLIVFRPPVRARRGSTLAMMLVIVVCLAGLSVAMLSLGLSHSKEQRGERQEIHASYVCQAGLSEAMYQLLVGQSGDVGTQANPQNWGTSSFWVDAEPVTADITRLRATGRDNLSGASEELVVRRVVDSIWQYGLFGREGLHMDSNARVDSYDSTLGTYAAQATNGSGSDMYALSNGHVGSNGDMQLDANAHVWGNATPGPGHTTTVTGNAIVEGSTTPATAQLEMPALNVPTYTSYGNLTVNGAGVTLPTGNRSYGQVLIRTNKTLTLTGPSTIVMSSLRMESGANIIVDSTNGPVTIYVLDNFILDSNAVIRSTDYKPDKVRINLLSDNVASPEISVTIDTVDFNSNSMIYGILFAPYARITLDSYFTLYGALMARSLDVDSNSTFHFDEDLIHSTANANISYETLSWREIPYQH